MKSTDHEYEKRSLRKRDHHEKIHGAHSPFTRGRTLNQMVNVEQLPQTGYLNMVQDATGAVQTFYFVVGYSRVGGPDVVR